METIEVLSGLRASGTAQCWIHPSWFFNICPEQLDGYLLWVRAVWIYFTFILKQAGFGWSHPHSAQNCKTPAVELKKKGSEHNALLSDLLLFSRKWVCGWEWRVYRPMVPSWDSAAPGDGRDPCFGMSSAGHPVCVLFAEGWMDVQRARTLKRGSWGRKH